MKLLRLELENFCQHRQLEAHFDPVLTFIVGPNGAGKTNLLRAIRLAIFGDSGVINKSDDVTQGIGITSHSYVALDAVIGKTRVHIQRHLKPKKHLLKIVGGENASKIVTGFNAVNSALNTLAGIPLSDIRDFLFVKQRQIDSIFDSNSMSRLHALSVLFGLSKSEDIWKELGEFINDKQGEASSVVPEAMLQDQLIAAQKRYAELASEKEELESRLPADYQQQLDTLAELIAKKAKFDLLTDRRREYSARLCSTVSDIRRARGDIRKLKADLDRIENEVAVLAQQAAMAKKAAEHWKMYSQYMLTSDPKWAIDAFRSRPAYPDTVSISQEEIARLAWLGEELSSLRRTLNQLAKETKSPVCYACGQPLPNFEERKSKLEELQRRYDALAVEHIVLNDKFKAYRAYEEAKCHIRLRRASIKETIRRCKEAKRLVGDSIAPPELAESQIQSILESYTAGQSKLDAARRCYDHAIFALNERIRAFDALKAEYRELKRNHAALAESGLETDTAEALQKKRDALSELVSKYNACLAQLNESKLRVDSAQAALAHARVMAEKNASRANALNTLSEIRTIFHVNSVPRYLLSCYMQAMQVNINQTLSIFDAPFTVSLDDSAIFYAHFRDGRIIPDYRLSVGQRILLAWAFRLAFVRLFAEQLGLLVLDEPTAGLDAHNLSCLASSLEHLRTAAEQFNLQIIFVTHEESLANLGRVIRL